MIVSIVEKESEHTGTQRLLVRGSTIELTTELSNIVKELLKKGFPDEAIFGAVLLAVEENHRSKRA